MPFITQGRSNVMYILIVVVVAIIVIGGLMVYQYLLEPKGEISPPQKLTENSNEQRPEISGKCRYESVPQNEFLEKYATKKGDTLLSIAKSELNDTSRVQEIIQLNKNTYPELSLQDPFIEEGWSFYLPPKDIITTGIITKGYAEILEIHETYWFYSYGNSGGNLSWSSQTKFEGKSREQYKVGDCIVFINGAIGNKAISISPQE